MDISGNTPSKSSCNCQTCRLARAKSKPQKKGQESEIRRVGQRVSTDLKTLPHECLDGMKYVIPFVDHYSTCTRVYFSADKRPATITKIALSYIKDMKDLCGVEAKAHLFGPGTRVPPVPGCQHDKRCIRRLLSISGGRIYYRTQSSRMRSYGTASVAPRNSRGVLVCSP